jgi:hypothetical protein
VGLFERGGDSSFLRLETWEGSSLGVSGVLQSARGESKEALPTAGKFAPSTLSKCFGNLGDPSLEGFSFDGLEVDKCSKCERREETAFYIRGTSAEGMKERKLGSHDRRVVSALLIFAILRHIGY